MSPLASSQTSSGAPSTPSTQVSSKAQLSTVATLAISTRVASSPSLALVPASTGTKAWLKAPSANRRRNRLGMRNATLKASVSAFAPNMEAMSRSRSKPVIREASVNRETVEAALKSDTRAVYSLRAPAAKQARPPGLARGEAVF
ncbi:hypothetical protein D3C80_1627740 [compost metagenome]